MTKLLTLLNQYLTTKYGRKFSSRTELERWQNQQVIHHLKKILPLSPYHQSRFQDISIENWRMIPTIQKKEMMENFDQLNTAGITKEEAFSIALRAEEERNFSPTLNGITIGLSSGTSGNRGIFLASPKEQAQWAGSILAKVLPEPLWKKQRIAFFMRANSNLYKAVDKGPLELHFFDMWKPIEDQLSELMKLNPTILIAPPTVLNLLVKEINNKTLHISPNKVISIAETLDPLDEKQMETTFNQKTHQIYQCTEGFLATTCPAGVLHLNEDLLVIEKQYVDEASGRFHPIITDFTRTSQLIIRHLLDDVLVEQKTPCACGSHFTALKFIEGRADDVFYGENLEGTLVPIFPDFVRRTLITSHSEIKEYFALQLKPNEIIIDLIIPNEFKESAQDTLEKNFSELFAQYQWKSGKIFFQSIEKTAGKKLRRIERRYPL